jgi:hypothetical protein
MMVEEKMLKEGVVEGDLVEEKMGGGGNNRGGRGGEGCGEGGCDGW